MTKEEAWTDEASKLEAQREKTIVTLGDSLTAGYGLEKSESYPSKLQQKLSDDGFNYTVVNAGVSWDTSAQGLARVSDYEAADIAIVVIGWNDGLQNKSLSTMKENINSIIDFYLEQWSQVVLWGIEVPPFYGLSYSRDFRDVYFEIAKQREWEIYFYESFLQDVGWVAQYNQSDKIHPTAEWYDIIVKNLYDFLEDEDILIK